MIGRYKARGPVCITGHIQHRDETTSGRKKNMKDSPPNVKEGNIIKALDDFPLHLIDGCRTPCYTKTKLRCSPILFDEVEFAVIFWVEVAQMAARLDQLLKLGLLRDKFSLRKKDVPATAVSAVRQATKTWALRKKVSLGPQTTLPNDDLHSLEPSRHGGVVFRKIKRLRLAIWEFAVAHAWTVRVVRPPFLRCCKRSQLVNKPQKKPPPHRPRHHRAQRRQCEVSATKVVLRASTKGRGRRRSTFEQQWRQQEARIYNAPFTIFRADMASGARF